MAAKKKITIKPSMREALSSDDEILRDVLENPKEPKSRSDVISEIREARGKPRRYTGPWVPPEVHILYEQMGRADHEKIKAVEEEKEKWKRDHSWRALIGRLVGIRG
jgi:hypothetical protein